MRTESERGTAWRTVAKRGPLVVVAVLLVAALLVWVGGNWDRQQFTHTLQALFGREPTTGQASTPPMGPAGSEPSTAARASDPAVRQAIADDATPDADLSVPVQPLEQEAPARPALRGVLADAVAPVRAPEPTPEQDRRRPPPVPPMPRDAPEPTPRTADARRDESRRDELDVRDAAVTAPERRLARTATSMPERPTPPRAPAVVPPEVRQAGRLLDAFSSRYADGDLGGLIALFSTGANAGTGGVPALRAEYSALFRATRRRSLMITGVQWRARGAALVGKGHFLARLVRSDGSQGVANGNIEVVVEHGPRGPTITELHHRDGG